MRRHTDLNLSKQGASFGSLLICFGMEVLWKICAALLSVIVRLVMFFVKKAVEKNRDNYVDEFEESLALTAEEEDEYGFKK